MFALCFELSLRDAYDVMDYAKTSTTYVSGKPYNGNAVQAWCLNDLKLDVLG